MEIRVRTNQKKCAKTNSNKFILSAFGGGFQAHRIRRAHAYEEKGAASTIRDRLNGRMLLSFFRIVDLRRWGTQRCLQAFRDWPLGCLRSH
jgi:hypothetical protein